MNYQCPLELAGARAPVVLLRALNCVFELLVRAHAAGVAEPALPSVEHGWVLGAFAQAYIKPSQQCFILHLEESLWAFQDTERWLWVRESWYSSCFVAGA